MYHSDGATDNVLRGYIMGGEDGFDTLSPKALLPLQLAARRSLYE